MDDLQSNLNLKTALEIQVIMINFGYLWDVS